VRTEKEHLSPRHAVVCDDLPGDKTTGWLCADFSWGEGLYVSYPATSGFSIVRPPCTSKPRRTEERITCTMRPIYGLPGEATKEEQVLPADPGELCDAYDAWVAEFKTIVLLLAEVWKRHALPLG
jgi:hypothetical protein